MTMSKQPSQESDFDRITPVSMDVGPIPASVPPDQKRPKWLWPVAGISVVLVLWVFIGLPGMLQGDKSSANAPDGVAANIPVSTDRSKQSSPWQEAQWAKQRKQSQQALGELLDKQSELEKIAVQQWASNAYDKALALAAKGDDLYRQKDYLGAANYYQQGAQKMQMIWQQSDQVFDQTMQKAGRLLQETNGVEAEKFFQLALSLRPDNSAALRGVERAQKIDQILSLKSKGQAFEKNQQLDEALSAYRQAQKLDRDSTLVLEPLNTVRNKILERDINQALAKGYLALQNNEFDKARSQFKRAKSLGNSSDKDKEITAALVEVDSQQTLYRIARQRKLAVQYKNEERWQQASATYTAILTIDPNLDFAKTGLINSRRRLALEQQLLSTIEQPERLSNKQVYQQSKILYEIAGTVNNPGNKLQQQTRVLATLLKKAITPVEVILESDELTDVTVYQVAHIGSFTNHVLSLKPGKYTAVGSRDGYRDVRKEFQVVLEQPASPVVIKCREKIL
jgi:tetratricopeptide (TPR) repeat protein